MKMAVCDSKSCVSVTGIWVAHGEGRVHFSNPTHLHTALERRLAPLRYVDDQDQCTERYPFNPNGSPHGIAALCSENGRHLAIMPHPERSFLKWQVASIAAISSQP
jgi:phosphoribosylformylglycinamidine synthase